LSALCSGPFRFGKRISSLLQINAKWQTLIKDRQAYVSEQGTMASLKSRVLNFIFALRSWSRCAERTL